MNGHANAEVIGFSLLEIARRMPPRAEGPAEAPIFLFAVDWHSGHSELCQRIEHAAGIGRGAPVDASLIDALARQFLRVAQSDARGTSAPEGRRVEKSLGVRALAEAQSQFLRAMASRGDGAPSRWGLGLVGVTGEYALYLKLLFPNAKFVFLHRDPVDSFREWVRATRAEQSAAHRDSGRAASFAEHWCKIVASFEMWREQAGALVVGCDLARAEALPEIEHYLNERLPPTVQSVEPYPETPPSRDVRNEEIAVIVQRAAAIAARYGYSLGAAPLEVAQPRDEPTRVPTIQAVHTETVRISCAVLVPAIRYVEPDCEEALQELRRRGYRVIHLRGCPWVDHARGVLATGALDQGFDETLWVDADIGFDADDVERLRSHDLPIVAGVYSRRYPRAGLAIAPLPGMSELVMGEGGGLVEVLYAATGFLLVRREVYTVIHGRFSLPVYESGKLGRAVPFFMPMLEDWGGKLSYLGDDYSFSRRARLCGYKIMADTKIRLWHIGMYRYSYEDAGNEVQRVPTYKHIFEPEQRRE